MTEVKGMILDASDLTRRKTMYVCIHRVSKNCADLFLSELR